MKILFEKEWFSTPVIPVAIEFKSVSWYLRILGFNVLSQLEVQDEPIKTEDGYTYTVKLISYTWYWLGIKLKTKNYDTRNT